MSENINLKDDFGVTKYVDEVTISRSPNEFVMDFKKIAPRFTRSINGGNNTTVIVEHSPLVMTPYFAKVLLKALEKQVSIFEDQVGEIKINGEKESKDNSSYIGW